MDNVNRTLYIPLYGKAYVSKKNIILQDKQAEAIWAAEGFSLKSKSRSKWLAYYMGMRAAVFDQWVIDRLRETPDAVVLHIGCGLDSRNLRTGVSSFWYDIDFTEVIAERRRFYQESDTYQMIGADARDPSLFDLFPKIKNAIVVMEGVSMYLKKSELTALLNRLTAHFENVQLLLDCYTEFAAKASRYKNPINDVGVTQVYGMDDPRFLEVKSGLVFVQEHDMTPPEMINQLKEMEKCVFRTLYGGVIARKMYRLYEYRTFRK